MSDKATLEQKLSELQQKLESDPQNQEVILGLGDVYFKLNDYELALEYYEQLVGSELANINMYLNMGVAYNEFQEYEPAAKCFEQVIKLKKNHFPTWFNLGNVYNDIIYLVEMKGFEPSTSALRTPRSPN